MDKFRPYHGSGSQSVTSLALWTPRFSLVPVNVAFVLDKVAQAQASFPEY